MATYYDLSPTLGPTTPAWPTDPPVVFYGYKAVATGGSSNVTKIAFGSHAGSHVDAPRHFFSDKASVDDLSLELLIGEAVVVETDVDIIDEAALSGALPDVDNTRVLLKTKNSALWAQPGFSADFVGLTAGAADFLVARGVKLVGIDYLSIEAAHGSGAPAHQALLGNDVVIVEGLDMSAVAPGRYELFCLPLKLEGLDGAPARVVLREKE